MAKIWKGALLNIRKWGSCYRIYMILPLIVVFTSLHTSSIKEYMQTQGLAISNWYSVFQLSDSIIRMLFYFALILLLCNAPFVDEQQMFMIVRTGRKNWIWGQILYTFLANVIFFFAVALVGVLIFIPHVGFSMEWESILETLAQSGEGRAAGINFNILHTFTPIQAFLLTYSLDILIGFFISLVMFWVNMLNSKIKGSIVAVGIVVCSHLAGNYWHMIPWLNFVSPVSWSSLGIFVHKATHMNFAYAYSFLLIGIAIFIGLIVQRSKHYVIEAKEED